MRPLEELVRPNIRTLKPYSTARDEFSGGEITTWLDANENPYDNGVNRYPDPHQKLLKQKIAALKGVREEQVFIGNGSDEAIGQNARLLLNKTDLKAIGKLRNSDKQRVFKINPATGNPNIGTIEDGGNIVPYTIVSDLTALSASTAGSAAIQTMLYGDPANYELGLFGDYTVRVDDSVKAVERMVTILGDAMVGGNLIVDKGFVIANLPKSGG
mgnify:CR=1 FL=1